MIATRVIRELTLDAASSVERPRSLSAASGLVLVGACLYVVADDENHLGVFPAQGEGDGRLARLFPGDLPLPHKQRKASKPDPEALTLLPPFAGFPSGALLAWGSGSRPTRRSAALIALDRHGQLSGLARCIDLEALYAVLEIRFPELNIEGAAVLGNELLLLQRGSRKAPENACIRLPLAALLDAITCDTTARLSAGQCRVHTVDLGDLDGTPLSFTDAAALPDGRILFTAVAENAKDSYEDGPCAGAVIGLLDGQGRLQWMDRLESPHKVEGIHARVAADGIDLILVTDADDVSVPGLLLTASLPANLLLEA